MSLPPPQPPPRATRSGAAIASLVVGLAGLLLCFTIVPSVVAIVLGGMGLRATGRRADVVTGRGMAIAGIVTGAIGLVAGVTFIALALSGAFDDGDTALTDLAPGDCVDLDPLGTDASIMTVPVVDCDEPHFGEVFHVGDLNPDGDRAYPTDDELFAEIDAICADRFAAYADPSVDPSRFRNYPIAPDENTWNGAAGRYVCIAMQRSAERFVGTLAESR
ncbi:MAG TPA: DUF4190 domain-containing protein [Ilumatobacteraceae bacterium]